jgi:hypothetical protein
MTMLEYALTVLLLLALAAVSALVVYAISRASERDMEG